MLNIIVSFLTCLVSQESKAKQHDFILMCLLQSQDLKLYVYERDAGVGTEKYTELCETVANSRKIIVILSNSYINNPSCLREGTCSQVRLKIPQYY